MLVLSRRVGEEIILTIPPSTEERRVTMKVVEYRRGDKVRIGVSAPDEIEVDRAEVRAEKDAEPRKVG